MPPPQLLGYPEASLSGREVKCFFLPHRLPAFKKASWAFSICKGDFCYF